MTRNAKSWNYVYLFLTVFFFLWVFYWIDFSFMSLLSELISSSISRVILVKKKTWFVCFSDFAGRPVTKCSTLRQLCHLEFICLGEENNTYIWDFQRCLADQRTAPPPPILPAVDWLTSPSPRIKRIHLHTHPPSRNVCSLEKCVKKRWNQFKNRNCFNLDLTVWAAAVEQIFKAVSGFYPGDLVTRTGEREICTVSGKGRDKSEGVLACTRISYLSAVLSFARIFNMEKSPKLNL